MRKVRAAILMLSLSGCALPTKTFWQETFGLGLYRLIAVQNNGLPHRIEEGTLAGVEVMSGDFVFYDDLTFEMWVECKAQVTALEPLPFTRKYAGTYTKSDNEIILTWQNDRSTTAVFAGRTVRVVRGDVEYLFVK